MKRKAALLILLALSTLHAPASYAAGDGDEAIFQQVTSSIFCPCGCERMLVSDCSCGMAFRINDFTRERIAKGQGEDEIRAALVEEHGEDIIPISAEKGFGLAAWIASVAAFLVGGGVVAAVLTALVRGNKDEGDEPAPEADDAYRSRVEEELKGQQ